MRMGGGTWGEMRTPTTPARSRRSWAMTASGGMVRAGASFRRMNREPWRPPSPPTLDMKAATLGLARTMAATWRCRRAISSKDTSVAYSVTMRIWPRSSLGIMPLGTAWKRTTVRATEAARLARTQRRWRRAASRLRR